MDRKTKLRLVLALTFARLPLALSAAAVAMVHAERPSRVLFGGALGLLVLSAATDWIDGFCARRFGVVSQLGAHADPLMDKFFYVVSLPLLVYLAARNANHTHAVYLLILTILFLMRDQWVTFLRAIGAGYGAGGAAHWSGKLRTFVNFPLICLVYYHEAAPWPSLPDGAIYAFETFALILTLVSLLTYTARYWPYISRAAHAGEAP